MSKMIHKQELSIAPNFEQHLFMPNASHIVKVGIQSPGYIALWYEHSNPDRLQSRFFEVFGTGQNIQEDRHHVGTVMDGDYVWHIYERRVEHE